MSLRSELEPITQLIIQWRKLELKYVEYTAMITYPGGDAYSTCILYMHTHVCACILYMHTLTENTPISHNVKTSDS